MPENASADITELLALCSTSGSRALERVMPLVYDELRRIAAQRLRKERAGHSFQATELVHEAYFRLVDSEQVRWQDRGHFFAIASQAMRRILVDHARRKQAAKRLGPQDLVRLDDITEPAVLPDLEIVALDRALGKLARLDPRQAQVVELRYFGGLSVPETAVVLEVSEATVAREWRAARLWLRREMRADD